MPCSKLSKVQTCLISVANQRDRMPPKFPIAGQVPARIVLWQKAHDPAAAAKVAKALYRAFFTEGVDISDPDAAAAVAVEAGDHGDALPAYGREPVLSDRDSGLASKGKAENLTGGDVVAELTDAIS